MSARDDYPYWPAPNDRRFSAEGCWHWSIAMDEIDLLRAQVGDADTAMRELSAEISRLRCVCDAAFSFVRDDGGVDNGQATWQELVNALEDARYEPRVDCDGPDCERQGAKIVHRPSCARWEP